MTQTIPNNKLCTAAAPRVPLSTIVTVLVDEWSRSYTVNALKGDIESMCMLSSAHFSKNGFGCIPHDTERGYDWLERAKRAVIEQAALDAKKFGMKICSRDLGEKEKELEKDIIVENCFSIDEQQTMDDNLSSGSYAESLSFSCDHDTTGSLSCINDVQAPLSDASTEVPSSHLEMESDSGVIFNSISSMSLAPSSHSTASTPRGSLRPSLSHPDLACQWKKWTDEKHLTHRNSNGTPMANELILYEQDDDEEDECSPPPQIQPEDECTQNDSTSTISAQFECNTAPNSNLPSEADSPHPLASSMSFIEADQDSQPHAHSEPESLTLLRSSTN